jgi:hypothetical protein
MEACQDLGASIYTRMEALYSAHLIGKNRVFGHATLMVMLKRLVCLPPTHPQSVPNFRNLAGLPSGGASGATNTADFLIQGRASVSSIIQSRSALPLDGNVGGLPELIINPANVRFTGFSVNKP